MDDTKACTQIQQCDRSRFVGCAVGTVQSHFDAAEFFLCGAAQKCNVIIQRVFRYGMGTDGCPCGRRQDFGMAQNDVFDFVFQIIAEFMMPLYSTGLWDAEMTTPASRRYFRTR